MLTRDQIAREQIEGGFSAVYPVLKAMEEAGKVRRGYFVDGQGGAQFAAAGADELLRARGREDGPITLVLASTDPASAYGVALPWPDAVNADAGKPQRAAGCRVVLSDGAVLAYLNKTCQSLTTFLSENEPERSQEAQRLARALADHARAKRTILLTKIDGASAISAPISPVLTEAGFTATTRGLLCRTDSIAANPRGPARRPRAGGY